MADTWEWRGLIGWLGWPDFFEKLKAAGFILAALVFSLIIAPFRIKELNRTGDPHAVEGQGRNPIH
jgi:hypothetical protein